MPWHISVFTPSIVWVVKYAIIKIGGRKAYDEIGMPAAFGIITGEIFGLIVMSIINIITFMIFDTTA